jgi:hypothetical protein
MSIFYTRHDGGLTLFRDGKQSTIASSHQNFPSILEALKARDYAKLESLMSIEKTINATGVSSNAKSKVFVRNGKVYFMDTRNRKEVLLDGALVDRILRDLGKPGCEKYANALMYLMENIQKNPLKDVAGELYEWLASGKAPITTDGCVLAYKKVAGDFKDIYTGTMDNSPGKIVRMKQAEVDTDRRNTCSHGLHFASLGYLSHYGDTSGSKVVIVKVNPRHIFAIPKDYKCQKGRTSEYYVVGEYKSVNREKIEAFNDAFIDEDNKVASAPEVTFVKSGLRPSLEALAESFNLCRDGKVRVGVDHSGRRYVLDQDVEAKGCDYKEVYFMSIETKSVRAVVKAAVAKLQKE